MSANSTILLVNGDDVILSGIANDDLLVRTGSTITGVAATSFQESFEKGQPNGYASLDALGKVPVIQLPATVVTVAASAPLSTTGTPTNPTIVHNTSGVTAGIYTFPTIIQTDATGHINSITPGTAPELLSNKNNPNGYAGLDPTGKISNSQIPPLAITSTTVVPLKSDLTTITTAEEGDVGIVTSDPIPANNGSYILTTPPYTVLANWMPLGAAGSGVTSVNGLPGPAVVLGANNITTGTLPAAQLPALSVTGDASGTGVSGTGSIPITLASTGVGAGSYANANITVNGKGLLTAASQGTNVSEILYQDNSSVSPGNNIIRRIGNADESSYLEMSGGCDIITPGNKMNVQCAQLNYDVVGSTARITTDDTLTLEGLSVVMNAPNTTTINTPSLIVTGISNATASDVLYYDSGTGNVTYGTPAGSSPTLNYQAFYFNQTWTTPSNLATNVTLRFPIDGGVFPLIPQGNLGTVFANSSSTLYDIRYTGPTKIFKVTLKGYVRFFPAGVTNTTQITWTLFADRPFPLSSITVPGSRQLMAINDPAAGRNSYLINMQGIVELNNTAVVSPTYFYAPSGAGTNTMIVDEMYILFEQLN